MLYTIGLILIYIGQDTSDTALLTSNDFGVSVDVGDDREASKDEDLGGEVHVNYVGYGFGDGNDKADNGGGSDDTDDERLFTTDPAVPFKSMYLQCYLTYRKTITPIH